MEDHWKRQRIGDERRKWGIKFHKASGKPDKLRRPGRPWDQAAFAGADRNTFTGGAANLFAYNSDHEKLRVGSNESIDRLMSKLQLQSYHNQVQQVRNGDAADSSPLRTAMSEATMLYVNPSFTSPAPPP